MESMMKEQGRSSRTFLRFLLVGLINTTIGLSTTLILLNIFKFSFWYATFIGNGIGTIISYMLNRTYTFESKAPHKRGIIRFMIVVSCSYFISYLSGKYLALYLSSNTTILPFAYIDNAAVLLGNGLYTLTNYLGQRYFVFNKKV